MPWNIQKAVDQILDVGMDYFDTLGRNLYFDTDKPSALSLHLKQVSCFNKGKIHKKYEFGRAYQLIRLSGNFIIIPPSTTIRMEDKHSIKSCLLEHQKLFGENNLDSVATDKGYYSSANEKLLSASKVKEIGISRPINIKKEKLHDAATIEKLHNRRSGIEPLIGHIKHGGQLDRSRMKNDRSTESSGYTSVLGFNLRQIRRYQIGKYEKEQRIA